jgi:hypothetical protein
MINGLGTTNASIVSYYSTNANAANYKKYLIDVVARLQSSADTVIADWNWDTEPRILLIVALCK